MRTQNIILYLLFGLVLVSCRKDEYLPQDEVDLPQDEVDFRQKYVGEYQLYVHSHHWHLGAYDYWAEDTVIGEVFIYDSTETYPYVQNTFSPFNSPEETNSGLTIRFTDYYHSHCYVYQNDTIRPANGYHYSHSGHFAGDSLYFNVIGLGGLGAGSDYYTMGKKL